jgi:hypothetical protein
MAVHFNDHEEHPGLADALDRAVAALNAMSPEERRGMRDAQRKSWVIGQTMLDHPDMTREEAERIYEQVTEFA